MKRNVWMLVALVLVSLPLAGQDPSLPIRRLPDGKPDLSGVYSTPNFANNSTKGVPPPINNPMPRPGTALFNPELYRGLIRPEAEKLMVPRDRSRVTDPRLEDPGALCLPFPFPYEAVVSPYAQQILQAPGTVLIFYEYMRFFKIIPLGAPNRPHADWDKEPTYMGDSIAWWDRDTLVVDTIGIKGNGAPYHSDALHTVERFTPVDAYRIDYQMTWDDPKVFTKPWSQNWKILRQPTWKILEYDCQENNRCMGGNCTKSDVQK